MMHKDLKYDRTEGSQHQRDNSYYRDDRAGAKQGYNRSASGSHRPHRKGKLSHNILPPPSILEAYDDIYPGSAATLFKMSKLEQSHRHQWEDDYLKNHIISYRIGQIFGLLIALSLVIATVMLAINGHKSEAKYLAVSGFISITLISLISARGRKFARRPNAKDGSKDSSGTSSGAAKQTASAS